jgi:capsule biosynthesis phosphatase
MKYVFDIDGTICNVFDGDYKNATPIMERINKINELFAQGHQIVFYSARGMGKSMNNVEEAKLKWHKITAEQLASWGVNYHFLFLGKPSGDFYVDDKAVTDLNFFS